MRRELKFKNEEQELNRVAEFMEGVCDELQLDMHKLSSYAILEECGLLLVINLGLDLTIDEFIAFCQCDIFQRVAGCNLCIGFSETQPQKDKRHECDCPPPLVKMPSVFVHRIDVTDW